MTAGGGVDVLDEVVRDMDRLSEAGASYTFAPEYVAKVRQARKAIAELIAADKAFDLSRAALVEVSNRITAGSRSDDDFRKQANAQHSYDRATARRASALAALEQQS